MTQWNSNQKQATPRVAVIGTGTMGTAMALRLLGAGMEVDVWSRHAASMTPLISAGATAYDTASDAVAHADVVITMLPTAEATIGVMVDGEALASMRPQAVWAQMATIGIRATEGLVAETRRMRPSVTYVDAPVSGSRDPAEKGQLLILASGPTRAAAPLGPVFDQLGRATLWLGPAGAGSRMKLVLNTWLAFQAEGAAEAAALAERLHVPTTALFTALRDNPLASPYALGKLTRMVEHDYHTDFSLSWALKDLDLADTEAGPGVVPVADAIAARWRHLVDAGSGGLDVSAARQGLGPDPSTSVPS
ncbi:MAG TPA: NAD(P)-dependent oxidoreductase [Acidimicrobiales bacterium]|nr:NAD(P)-dependent oxidoreductase [Acidimicrobiales bacterium]